MKKIKFVLENQRFIIFNKSVLPFELINLQVAQK